MGHTVASTVQRWLKLHSCSCVYRSDVNSDHGQPTSCRICYVMPKSYPKITGLWPCWQESSGTFVLSTKISKGHFTNSIGLWPMFNTGVHSCLAEWFDTLLSMDHWMNWKQFCCRCWCTDHCLLLWVMSTHSWSCSTKETFQHSTHLQTSPLYLSADFHVNLGSAFRTTWQQNHGYSWQIHMLTM